MIMVFALVYSLFVTSCYALALVPVRFSPASIKPAEMSYITDDFMNTCEAIDIDVDRTLPSLTMFRVTHTAVAGSQVDVGLTGKNLKCDARFYVTRITPADVDKWLGRWTICPLLERLTTGEIETCLYECQCPESCLEIQVIRLASSLADSSWTLCDVAVSRPTAIGQCSEVSDSGIYRLAITTSDGTMYQYVYCDMQTDGGGWMVLLRRQDGSVDFFREWEDYKNGFGSLSGEFWAGNELMHQVTNNGRTYSLRIDLTNYEGNSIFAKFSRFSVDAENTNYKLHATGIDASSTVHDKMKYQTNCEFSTASRDNDKSSSNFAMALRAPFWYCSTWDIVLTGQYGQASDISSGCGIKWYGPWSTSTYAKFATMMIRPN